MYPIQFSSKATAFVLILIFEKIDLKDLKRFLIKLGYHRVSVVLDSMIRARLDIKRGTRYFFYSMMVWGFFAMLCLDV
jgi:hypothetical protein